MTQERSPTDLRFEKDFLDICAFRIQKLIDELQNDYVLKFEKLGNPTPFHIDDKMLGLLRSAKDSVIEKQSYLLDQLLNKKQ